MFVQFRRLLGTKSPPVSSAAANVSSVGNKLRKPIVLQDADLEETFTKGGGKGGQKVNKAANAVCLKHIPTQIVIKCHETRSLEMNRMIARKRLVERLDWLENGNLSKKGQEIQKIRRKKEREFRRSREKHSKEDHSDEESDTLSKLSKDQRFAVHLKDLE